MNRFATDQNFNGDILRGLLRRIELDVIPIRNVGLAAADDPSVLEWAAAEGRVLLTHDRNTVPGYLYDRLRVGLSTPGVVAVDDQAPVGRVIDDLHLFIACGTDEDFRDQVRYMPWPA